MFSSVPAAAQQRHTTGPCGNVEMSALQHTVLDMVTRVPLRGASVRVSWRVESGIADAAGETDADGVVVICLPAERTLTVQAAYRSVNSEQQEVLLPAASFIARSSVIDAPHVHVRGRVLDHAAETPVHNAAVRVANTDVQAVTDAEGRFAFARLPVGDYELRVMHPEYAVAWAALQLRSADLDATIRLTPQPVVLAPVTVTAFSRRLDQVGFYERESRGIGTFIGRQQIEAAHVQFASDLLRSVPGLRLITTAARRDVPRSFTVGRGTCRFRFLVNGTPMLSDFELDNLAPLFIEGIEVYSGAAQVPALFRGRAADAAGGTCGIIAVWTRDRR